MVTIRRVTADRNDWHLPESFAQFSVRARSNSVGGNLCLGSDDSGEGTYTQIGGTTDVAVDVFVGYHPSGSGTYDLGGTSPTDYGTLSVDGTLYVGYEGEGTFTHTDGASLTADGLVVGYASSSATANSYRLEDGTFGRYPVDHLLGTDGAGLLKEAPDGAIWLSAFPAGVLRLGHSGGAAFTMADGLPGNRASEGLIDRDGQFWVALNGGGLARYDGDRITQARILFSDAP